MGYLYAVQMNIYGYPFLPIKIGKSDTPDQRSIAYRSGPFPTTWLGAWEVEDSAKEERSIHQKYAAFRLIGEWFYPTRGLVQFVERRTGYPIEVRMIDRPSRTEKEFQGRFVRLFPLGIASIDAEWDKPGRTKPCSDKLFNAGMANLDAIAAEHNPLVKMGLW